MKFLSRVAAIAALFAATSAHAHYIDAPVDLQWRQLTETSGLTWNELASVCALETGTCSGTVRGVDLSGWTWANSSQVTALFNRLGVPLNGYVAATPSGAAWIQAMVDQDGAGSADTGAFYATGGNHVVMGWERDERWGDYAVTSYVVDDGVWARARIFGDQKKFISSEMVGAWLFSEYRAPADVPEPATPGLLAAGIAALMVLRKRGKRPA